MVVVVSNLLNSIYQSSVHGFLEFHAEVYLALEFIYMHSFLTVSLNG
jgi:hypothetical protein